MGEAIPISKEITSFVTTLRIGLLCRYTPRNDKKMDVNAYDSIE